MAGTLLIERIEVGQERTLEEVCVADGGRPAETPGTALHRQPGMGFPKWTRTTACAAGGRYPVPSKNAARTNIDGVQGPQAATRKSVFKEKHILFRAATLDLPG